MISIAVPSGEFHGVGFQPEAEFRQELGTGSLPPLLEKLSIAPPIVVSLRPEQADEDPRVAEFLKSQADRFRFSLVHFKVSFAPTADEPITMAVVEVALEPNAGITGPIVINMKPDKVADPSELKRDLEGTVELEIAGGKLGFTVKGGTERVGGELFLVAAGIGQKRVGWEINETPSVKIGGVLVFNLILQSAVGLTSTGRIAVTAQVQRKRFGLIPYRALLDNTPIGRFNC